MKCHRRPLLFLVVAMISACGTEVASVSINATGAKTATAPLKGNTEIGFWTNWKADYQGGFKARYMVDILQNGQSVAKAECNPQDVSVKMNSLVTSFNNSHSESYSGKMRCGAKVPADGEYAIAVDFQVASESGQYTIKDASLVLKQ